METQTVIRTERLRLKAIGDSYAGRALDFIVRNKDNLRQWEPLRAEEYYTLGFWERMIADNSRKMEHGEMLRLWLFKADDEADEKAIGTIALEQIERGAFLSCRLGYKLDVAERNQGFMTEAVRAVIRYAFDCLNLHRIEATIMQSNLPSLRVVEKLGFSCEGLSRNYLKINGRWEDHARWTLFNERLEAH